MKSFEEFILESEQKYSSRELFLTKLAKYFLDNKIIWVGREEHGETGEFQLYKRGSNYIIDPLNPKTYNYWGDDIINIDICKASKDKYFTKFLGRNWKVVDGWDIFLIINEPIKDFTNLLVPKYNCNNKLVIISINKEFTLESFRGIQPRFSNITIDNIKNISSFDGLEKNLKYLRLQSTNIQDFNLLKGFTLGELSLSCCNIFSPLSHLNNAIIKSLNGIDPDVTMFFCTFSSLKLLDDFSYKNGIDLRTCEFGGKTYTKYKELKRDVKVYRSTTQEAQELFGDFYEINI